MENKEIRVPARFNLRLPTDLKAWIEKKANSHFRSATAQIVEPLEAARRAEANELAAESASQA